MCKHESSLKSFPWKSVSVEWKNPLAVRDPMCNFWAVWQNNYMQLVKKWDSVTINATFRNIIQNGAHITSSSFFVRLDVTTEPWECGQKQSSQLVKKKVLPDLLTWLLPAREGANVPKMVCSITSSWILLQPGSKLCSWLLAFPQPVTNESVIERGDEARALLLRALPAALAGVDQIDGSVKVGGAGMLRQIPHQWDANSALEKNASRVQLCHSAINVSK